MHLHVDALADEGVEAGTLASLLREHESVRLPWLQRLWDYYRNPAERSAVSSGAAWTGSAADEAGRYHLAQERGLPARLTGARRAWLLDDRAGRPEVVIENDIGWRIDALVDFVFGKPVRIHSTAGDASRRAEIELILDRAWEASGGMTLFQDAMVTGSVYGSVDLVLRTGALFGRGLTRAADATSAAEAAALLRVEMVEPTRGVPAVSADDPRSIEAYMIRGAPERSAAVPARRPWWLPAKAASWRAGDAADVELLWPGGRRLIRGGAVVEEEANPLGVTPVVHVQNASQPRKYDGLSDVEPLIPLQDELNTRLSDRASRVTLQSFSMYLAKGIESFGQTPIGPGQVWTTDNPDAEVQRFGGDAHSPSEERHIEEVRDALDKVSGISPIALGVVRAKLGHLSSENALRITLTGVLSKVARKRVAYGRGIAEMSRLMLRALDAAGVYRTSEAERGVSLRWEEALPTDERERLQAARWKLELGVPRERVLEEIGYGVEAGGVG